MTIIEHLSELEHPDHDDQAAKVFPHERYLLSVTAAKVERKLTPTEKKKARGFLQQFMVISEAHKNDVDYTQHRPFRIDVDPAHFDGDCSSAESQQDRYVWDHLDGPSYHDSNGVVEWDGYGYTGTLLAVNHKHPVPDGHRYLTGDIAICGTFWHTEHAFRCYQPGDAKTSVWWSHGSSAGPFFVRLHYRPDVLGVYRPVSLL